MFRLPTVYERTRKRQPLRNNKRLFPKVIRFGSARAERDCCPVNRDGIGNLIDLADSYVGTAGRFAQYVATRFE